MNAYCLDTYTHMFLYQHLNTCIYTHLICTKSTRINKMDACICTNLTYNNRKSRNGRLEGRTWVIALLWARTTPPPTARPPPNARMSRTWICSSVRSYICAYVHVCMYVRTFTYIYTCTYIYVHVLRTCICVYVCTYMYICKYTYIHIHVHIYICVCVDIIWYIYMCARVRAHIYKPIYVCI